MLEEPPVYLYINYPTVGNVSRTKDNDNGIKRASLSYLEEITGIEVENYKSGL